MKMKEIYPSLNFCDSKQLLEKREINYIIKQKTHIYISETDFNLLHKEISNYLDLDAYCKMCKISAQKKAKIKAKLKSKNLIIQNEAGNLLGKTLFSRDALSLIGSKQHKQTEYISINEIRNKYGITKGKIDKCLLTDVLVVDDNMIERESFIKAFEDDEILVPIEELMSIVSNKYQIKLTKKMEVILVNKIVDKCYWGQSYKLEETYVGNKKSKYGVFVDITNIPFSEIKGMITLYSRYLLPSDFMFMWTQMSEEETLICENAYACIKNSDNKALQPILHQIMSVIISNKKNMVEWTDADVEMIKRNETQTLFAKLKKALKCMKAIYPDCFFTGTQIAYFEKVVNHQPPYSLNQYLHFGNLLFSNTSLFENGALQIAIEKSECAQALLFGIMQYCAAWRKGDCQRLTTPEISNLIGKLEIIKQNNPELSKEEFAKAWETLELTLQMNASKNIQEIKIFMPEIFKVNAGRILCIAEYHRIRDGRLTLISKNCNNAGNFHRLFGDEYYEIFGKKNFSQRRLNKDFLVIQARGVVFSTKLNIRSLPELVAAYIRGHKLDLDKGQKTIFSYIGHSSEGLSIDAVTYELFSVGSLGQYKDLIAKLIIPEYANLMLKEKRKIIDAIDIVPADAEKMINRFLEMQNGIVNITKHGFVDTEEQIIRRIGENIGEENGNESNVLCLYAVLSGKRNPECLGTKYCEGKEGDGCKYAIYYSGYVVNIMVRIDAFKDHIKKLAIYEAGDISIEEKETCRNEMERDAQAVNALYEKLELFIENVKLDNILRTTLIKQIQDYRSNKDALPRICE